MTLHKSPLVRPAAPFSRPFGSSWGRGEDMHINIPPPHTYSFAPSLLPTALFLLLLLLFASPARAAKVIIISDTRYAMVGDVVTEIQTSLRTQSKEYATAEIKGRLGAVVEHEDAEVVVALGAEALGEALHLPPSIAVVYGLVVVPAKNGRENITGVYMSPPVSEYVAMVRRYLPELARISVIGSASMMKSLAGSDSGQVDAYNVGSSAELVNTVIRLGDARSLLLLPDTNLLTGQVMSNVFLFSFRNNIPLLGISETSVKQGALFALVFDPRSVSRQIGEKVRSILGGTAAKDLPAAPPKKYNLYINSNTAQKMGITIPEEMLRKAKRVYQ